MSGVTNHVAETAVPGQAQITIRAAHGEVEWHGIYVQPEHVLRLIRAMLLMIGMDDVKLYRGGDGPFALCEDVNWTDDLLAGDLASGVAHEAEAPKDRTAAERQRRHRSKKRDYERDTNRDGDRDSVTGQEQLRLVAAE
jgi:hypothetical protein